MSEDMNRLDEIAERLEAATPGPWEVWQEKRHLSGEESGGVGPVAKPDEAIFEDKHVRTGDADLIAHAPADLAALLAVVREVAKVSVPVGVTPSDDPWWKGHEEAMRRVRVQLAPLTETTEETNNAG